MPLKSYSRQKSLFKQKTLTEWGFKWRVHNPELDRLHKIFGKPETQSVSVRKRKTFSEPEEFSDRRKTKMKKTSKKENSPIYKLRAGSIQASVWENETKDGNVFNTVTLQRSYKDKNDEWQAQSVSMGINELLNCAAVLQRVHEEVKFKEE